MREVGRLRMYIINKLGKLKHEIDMEAHSRDRIYWQEMRITGMKRDIEALKAKVKELEENAR